MKARGSRSNARGDSDLHLLLLPRLFAQGRRTAAGYANPGFIRGLVRKAGEMSERSMVGWPSHRYPQSLGAPELHPQIS